MISKAMRRHQTNRCLNCGKLGHLKRDCRERISRNNISSGNDKSRRPHPSGICRRCGKGQHWSNEYRSTTDRQGNLIPSGNPLRGLSQAPKPKVAQSFPVTVENVSHQENCIYWIFGIQSVWILTFLDLEGGGRNLNFPQGRKP